MSKPHKQHCLICGYPAKQFAKKSGYVIYKCIHCGFGLTENLNAQTGGYHRDETYISEERLFENIFQRRVNEITKFIKSGKVLEIGCSTGLMLSLFQKRGFSVLGVEVSKKAAEIAKGRGVEVIIAPFEKINFSEKNPPLGRKFDLVILNHTLEHLENPIKVLEKIKSILNPKGYLMIDLPNFDSPVAKVLKSRWPHLLPDEHLWHFSPKSFDILLKGLDFRILKIKKASGIWDFSNPAKEIYHSFKSLKKRFVINVLTAVPSLIMTKLNKGSDLLVIARKK